MMSTLTSAPEHQPSMIVNFPTSNPEGKAVVQIDAGHALGETPSWSIDTLNVGPTRASTGYDAHVRSTVGSSYDWSDELRFDKRTGRLVSFVLKTPEAGTLDAAIAHLWLALPSRSGLPVLIDREHGFHIDPLDLRYMSEHARELVAVGAGIAAPDATSLRLAIGGGVELLFHQGSYIGWVLANPIAHLVTAPGEAPQGRDDPALHALLRDFLALVVQPNIDRMIDEEPEMRSALLDLHQRARTADGPQAAALHAAIARVLNVFYRE